MSNTYDFTGRGAVVTGGARGIGRAVVAGLLAGGAKVAIWDRDLARAEQTVAELGSGRQLYAVQVDITDYAAVEAARDRTVGALGGIDVLVNNAGIAGPTATTWEYKLEDWRQVFAINVDGTFHCCRAVIPGMIANGYGRIVNVASIAGKEGNPNASAYSASKAAVIGLTKSLAKEVATHDISVNAVTPAAAQTEILQQVTQQFIDYMLSKIPRGRFVTVEEVAAIILFAASADCAFTTGSVFDISGGRATY